MEANAAPGQPTPAAQHVTDTINEVNEDVRRKSNQKAAAAAAKEEQAKRTVQEWREGELNTEARRAVAQQTASKAVEQEHQDQLLKPRRPSTELADTINEVNETVRRKSNQKIVLDAAKEEQAKRTVQEWREGELNTEARRAVAQQTASKAVEQEHQDQLLKPRHPSAGVADTINEVNETVRRKSNQKIVLDAAKEEQAKRTVQEWREGELNTEARRAVAQQTASKAVEQEHQDQLLKPRRPSAGVADNISALQSDLLRSG